MPSSNVPLVTILVTSSELTYDNGDPNGNSNNLKYWMQWLHARMYGADHLLT